MQNYCRQYKLLNVLYQNKFTFIIKHPIRVYLGLWLLSLVKGVTLCILFQGLTTQIIMGHTQRVIHVCMGERGVRTLECD